MKTADLIDIAKILGGLFAAKKIGEYLGFIDSKEQKKGESSITDVLSGSGKVGKAFNVQYWNNNPIPEATANALIPHIGEIAVLIWESKGFFNDDESQLKTAVSAVGSIWEFSAILYVLNTPITALGYTNVLEWFKSFLTVEEMETYLFSKIKKLPYLP
jgi:hypothetical protein